MRVFNTYTVDIDLIEAFLQVKLVAHGGDSAVDRTGPDGNQHITVVSKFTQYFNVVDIGNTTFDESDITLADGLDVGQWRTVKLNQVDQLQDCLLYTSDAADDN